MSRINRIGNVRITGKEFREGMLDAETWPLIFQQNNERWKALGGCELSSRVSKQCVNPIFNYFPTSKDAVIEWSEESASDVQNIAASKAEGAVIDVARMPYLNHPATKLRPTLLAFEITGHVMLGIVYNHEGARGPEIHILNPWRLTSSKDSISDVFTLVKESLKTASRNVIIVEVVSELEKKFKHEINLQEFEKQGFCTLWVGILARAVIPRLAELYDTVRDVTAVRGSEQQLNDKTLNIYNDVYSGIEQGWEAVINDAKETFGEDKCTPTASAAKAAIELAKEAQKAGKRKAKRRTRRKSLYRSRWTKKRRNLR